MSLAGRLELLVGACLALGYVLGYQVGASRAAPATVMEERRSSAEAGVGSDAPRLADPSRPPRSFKEDCARSGQQFLAWRGDAEEWQYACLDAWLARPEVILGR